MTQMHLRLHLGAHKTATTYLQNLLKLNADRILNFANIAYLPMPPARKIITPNLWRDITDNLETMQADIQANLEAWLEQRYKRTDFKTLLISEENFIGDCGQIANTGLLYPRVHVRCQRLKAVFADPQITILLCIRNYADFFTSAYCESVRHAHDFIRFEEFQAKINLKKRRWPNVIQDILKVFPGAPLRLWCYEDFRKNESLIINQMLGRTVPNLRPVPQNVVRPSSSRQAIEVLHLIDTHAGAKVAAEMVGAVEKLLPKVPKLDSYDPWSPDERRTLNALYEEDLSVLQSRPGIQFLLP